MKKNTTTINEKARDILDITRDEYALCSYVHYRLADSRGKKDGWCSDTKDEISDFIGISRPGLYKMIDRMDLKRLLDVDAPTGFLRTTGKWIDTESDCKQSLQKKSNGNVNKVSNECKQSLQVASTKLTESVNLVTHTNKVELDKVDIVGERERDAHANSKPSKAEISKRDVAPPESPEQITPWNEDLLAAEFLKHIAGETPETAAKHAKEICQKIDMQMPPNDRAPLRYDQYPRPTNAKELREAMSAYFKDNPHEWSDGVLEEGKAKNWPKEKVMDTVTMFCAHQESEGNFKRTYGQYKGMIVKWFLNQSRFDIPVQPNGHSVNREQSVLPSNIRRYK